ncbi:CHAP domain-containing protein [Nocardioides oleivorans]|uniref:CHAP domain-containing protein n=1 Tax=Nocardioides oleivorans TaxID=273676 RepID=A0A4Q2RVU5_9ACTN|nr:CHAP domain-containing protein [Nocardioides oleivorans]RYB92064.1 CHAP domain-containing protein [Nocardioides oleivorans]
MHHQSQQSHPSHRTRGGAPARLVVAVGRVRRIAGLLVGTLALVVTVLPSTAGTQSVASTYLCSSYSGCQAAGYGSGGYRQANGTQYWKMFAGHNCTNYIAYRLIQNGMPDKRPWSGDGDAKNWGVAMASITDQTPRVGAIAWYRAGVSPAGSSGHVAYVEQVISPTEIIVSEDYWGGDFHWRRATAGSGWPSGFIHFNDQVVEPTTAPTIAGTPMVGAPLEVVPGAWTPAPTAVTYQWSADGTAISGATAATYVPTPDVKGKTLTAAVTAQLSGYAPGAATLTTAPVAPGTFQPTALPAIQGTPEVGQTLSLTAASWSPQPAKATTQWYADGKALPGATGSSFVLGRDQVGARISARVTGSSKGYRKARTTAPDTEPVLAKPVTLTSPSTVSGRAEVGKVLTVKAGSARPSGATVSYSWLRDGKPIGKATNPRYTLRTKDLGRAISVQVTSSHRNFRATTETIAAKAPVTTVAEVRVRAQASRKRVTVDLRVKAPGAPAPDGAVTVRIGGQTVTGQLTRGRERLVVRGLAPGRYRVLVTYAGTPLVQPAKARATILVARGRG